MKSNLLILVACLFILPACKEKDITKEAFAGLRLGSYYKDYNISAKSSKFNHLESGQAYYTFSTQDGKEFYTPLHCTINKDSIVLAITLYPTQSKTLIPTLGIDMNTGKEVSFNLVEDGGEGVPSALEIYEHLKNLYSNKYRVDTFYSYSTGSATLNTIRLNKDDNVEILLEQFINERPSTYMPRSMTPMQCIRVIYKLNETYIKEHDLDNYKSKDQDI